MPVYDVTKLNVGIDKVLAVTTNPRHKFLFQAYSRNRYLEVAAHLPSFFSDLILKKVVAKKDYKADENVTHLYTTFIEMIWPYDGQGRLLGEDVWEPDPEKADILKLDPADVLTTAEARKLLDPLIKPLPSFSELVLGQKGPA